ncbi:acetyltransferase, GNAT family [Geomicrobium sp. JCM 19038]|nr:acetyltransferase, GNAT family [Geomicrobium sp. JCM 19038]
MSLNMTKPASVRELSNFLATMNNQPKHHIGFCGEDSSEIYDTLVNDFSDLPFEESFVVAYKENAIVGALGLDIDLPRGVADVWGPFIHEEEMGLAVELWNQLIQNVPKEVSKFSFFINKENTFVKQFAIDRKGIERGSDLVLQRTRESFSKQEVQVEPYMNPYCDSFSDLHNQLFPNTYYDGQTIHNRLNDDNQLIVVTENESTIQGYVYFEASPKHSEGTIEYVGVAEAFRKQGVAKRLIRCALNELFSYESINEITICVEADHQAAIALYQSVGFEVKYQLLSYQVDLDS